MAQRDGRSWAKKHSHPDQKPSPALPPIEKTVNGTKSVIAPAPGTTVIRIPRRTYEKACSIRRRMLDSVNSESCADSLVARIGLGRIFARAIDEYDRNHPAQGDPT
jgi:hypothetical protein